MRRAGSIIGAVMVLAPRIMRGELVKLPSRNTPGDSAGRNSEPRTQRDLDKLQAHLAAESGIGIDILCDFLHGIPGFTHRRWTRARVGTTWSLDR
jgi:hypothetical protein